MVDQSSTWLQQYAFETKLLANGLSVCWSIGLLEKSCTRSCLGKIIVSFTSEVFAARNPTLEV